MLTLLCRQVARWVGGTVDGAVNGTVKHVNADVQVALQAVASVTPALNVVLMYAVQTTLSVTKRSDSA